MLDRIREWGEKTANWVGEALSMGEVPPDADVNRFQTSFDYASLSHILHYETYDPDTKIFYNQKPRICIRSNRLNRCGRSG